MTAAVRLSIPAKAEYIVLCRLALSGLANAAELSSETLADLKLALTEACSNSVRHAYGDGSEGVVEVAYEVLEDRIEIAVADEGPGFEASEAALRPEDFDESGLGIAIIRSLTDELEVGSRPGGAGSRLRFVKLLA